MERRRPPKWSGPPRGAPSPPSPAQDLARRRAEELVRSHGLDVATARLVAAGRADLNAVLQRMARADEVQRLMAKHGFNRALATQIALGHADLEATLARRRVEEHLESSRRRSILDDAFASHAELTLGVQGHRTVRGVLTAVDPYEVVIQHADGGAEERIHKVLLKYAFLSADFKKIKKGLEYDNERRERTVEPRFRPQERFGCSDRRLGLAMDRKVQVVAVTLEGECFIGEVAWVGRFEFGVRTRAGGEVVVFRHALDDFRDDVPHPRTRSR